MIAISPLVVPFSGLTFIPEGLLLLMGEQFEVFIIKLTGVMAFDLLAILQSDGSGFESLVVVAILSAIGIVVFAILLLFGRGLLDLPGVFIGVTGVWISPDNLLLWLSHSFEAGAIWILCCLDCIGMHVLQLWVPHLAK